MASGTTVVFDNDRISICQYRCRPDSELWHRENHVGARAELAFPRRAVSIRQHLKPQAVASPNEVVLYNPFNRYTRQPIDPRGDLCEVIAVQPEIMEEIAAHVSLPSAKLDSRFFGDAIAPCSSRNYLWQRSLFMHVQAHNNPDPVLVEESVLSIVKQVLIDAANFFQKRKAATKKRTSVSNRELAEAAAEFVSKNHKHPITLKQIAEYCGCSVFHLSHVFQANKGVPVYQYLIRYRLRAAIARVGDTKNKGLLNRIAFDFCFSSHSHFTKSFARQFGMTPSQFREMESYSVLKKVCHG